jgi:hypothetical protein
MMKYNAVLNASTRDAAVALLADLRFQAHRLRWPIGLASAFAALVLGAAVLLHVWRDVPFRALMQDPAAYLGVPAYVGVISTLGVILWLVAGTATGFAAWFLHRAGRSTTTREFMLASAAFSCLLGADDLLQLHEDILPLIGIPQKVILVGYGALAFAYLCRFWRIIITQSYLLLLIAFAFLALSLAQDILLTHGDLQTFFEDAAKLVGIIFWTLFLIAASADVIDPRNLRSQP